MYIIRRHCDCTNDIADLSFGSWEWGLAQFQPRTAKKKKNTFSQNLSASPFTIGWRYCISAAIGKTPANLRWVKEKQLLYFHVTQIPPCTALNMSYFPSQSPCFASMTPNFHNAIFFNKWHQIFATHAVMGKMTPSLTTHTLAHDTKYHYGHLVYTCLYIPPPILSQSKTSNKGCRPPPHYDTLSRHVGWKNMHANDGAVMDALIFLHKWMNIIGKAFPIIKIFHFD